MLAERDPAEVRRPYAESDVDVERLLRDLQRVRCQGLAVNDQKTETGVRHLAVRDRGVGRFGGSPLDEHAGNTPSR